MSNNVPLRCTCSPADVGIRCAGRVLRYPLPRARRRATSAVPRRRPHVERRRTRHRCRPVGEGLQDHPRGRRHFLRARKRFHHRAARRQRRRQDHHHRHDHGAGHAHLRHGESARRRDAAPALSGTARDEFRESARRHAAPPAGALRTPDPGGGISRRRARPRRNTRGRAMSAPSISAVTLAPHRIAAMVLRYVYLLRSSWTRLVELIYWPAVQLLVWGFLQFYIAQNSGFFARASGVFIAAVLMWDVLFRGQLGFSVSFLEEMLSRNLTNLMLSPLRPIELVCALMIMSLIRLAIGMLSVTFHALAFI